MSIGISNQTAVSLHNITEIANISNPGEFLLKANHIMFADWFYFIILLILAIIGFVIAQKFEDLPLNNAMYVAAACTVIGFLMRAYCMDFHGTTICLVNDFQVWVFPLIAVIFAGFIYISKQ